ncbi:MAG: 16S rRNA (cytosine(1402)-N(4))-methyltransferase RsmH [Verrucomicrobiota bacterium]
MERFHQPVMPEEVTRLLRVAEGGRFIDATVGGGGHSEKILQSHPGTQVLGIDRDIEAIRIAEKQLSSYGDRIIVRQGVFSEMKQIAEQTAWQTVDGVLMDLGLSSIQLDKPERGFSFKSDAPLDMRMDRNSSLTASRLLNTAEENRLADIFYKYGEERRARQVARAVVERRKQKKWERTGEFAQLVEKVIGTGGGRRRSLPPATRCFQALRIAVNSELQELEQGLTDAIDLLKAGGRIVVISFHSLEDRIVKNTFKYEAASCICPPGIPECRCEKDVRLEIITRKPQRPTNEEIEHNRRAKSARLRVAEKK